MRAGWPAETYGAGRDTVLGFLSNPELVAVFCFCAIGLVASILLALCFPPPDELVGILAQIL